MTVALGCVMTIAAAVLFAHLFAPPAWVSGMPIPTSPSYPAYPEVTTPSASDTRPNVAGVQLELLPVGLFHVDGDSYNLDTSYAVGGVFGHDVARHFNLGFAPRVVFGLEGEGGDGSTLTEYDLRARAALHARWKPQTEIYAFVEPGWSFVSVPWGSLDGFVAAVGVGGTYDVSDEIYLNLEFGFQGGFQGETVNGSRVSEQLRLMHLGLGVGTRF